MSTLTSEQAVDKVKWLILSSMKIRFNDRVFARELRGQGFSFSEIMKEIPNLSKGTLNGWLKDIELSKEQKVRLLLKIKEGADRGRLKGAFRNHQKRIETTDNIIRISKSEVNKDVGKSLFEMGIMLYWAEGDKSTSQERVAFTNSDPKMIEFMMRWFRKICKVPEAKFRIALQIMVLHDKTEIEKFWSKITRVSLANFNKTIIKHTSIKGKRRPSYMGTCSIRISDKNLFRKIMGWKLGVLENL